MQTHTYSTQDPLLGICSLKPFILKGNCEQFVLIALLKRSKGSKLLLSLFNMSNLLPSSMTKEWPWANRSQQYVKKSNMIDLLMIWGNHSLKLVIHLIKFIFFVCFWQLFMLFPFLWPRANHSWVSLCSVALLNRAMWAIRSHPSSAILNKWANLSRCSFVMSDGSNLLFFTSESLFHSKQKKNYFLKYLMSEFPTESEEQVVNRSWDIKVQYCSV